MNSIPYIIDLHECGIYLLNQDGASGKSYLCKLIQDYSIVDKSCMAITYNSERRELDMLEDIRQFDGKFLLLDRLDLYHSDELLHVVQSKDIVTLVDLKDDNVWRTVQFKFASVRIEKNCVIVKEI